MKHISLFSFLIVCRATLPCHHIHFLLYVSLVGVMVYDDTQVCFYNVQVTTCHLSSSFHRNKKFLLFFLDFGAVWQNKVYIIYVAMMIGSLLIEHCLEAGVEMRHLLFSSCYRGAQVRLHSLS